MEVNAEPRPLYSQHRDMVSIVQEAGWASSPGWTGAEYLAPTGFDPRNIQPLVGRYTDWAIPARDPCNVNVNVNTTSFFF